MMRGIRLPLALIAALIAVAAVPLAAPAESGAVTARTARFVAGFEGFYSCVYADPAGHATIGYGHLIHLGPPTRKDRRSWGCLTNRQALRLLRRDLRETERAVFARIRGARVTPSMITALTSFAFNLGSGALGRYRHLGTGRITNIAGNVRKGRYYRAGRQLLLYNGAVIGGKRQVLAGLVTRRWKEYRLLVRDADRLTRRCRSRCDGGNPGGVGVSRGPGNGGMTVR